MDIELFKMVVAASRRKDSGLPYLNTLKAAHATAVHFKGADRVGDLSLYPVSLHDTVWTLELCKLDALQYKTRGDWQRQSAHAYETARKRGWLNLCCAHMIEIKKPRGYWTLERCMESAIKYSTRRDWRLGDSKAWASACANRWVDVCCAHMVRLQKTKGYWTFDRCKESAQKYSYKVDWLFSESSPYSQAYINGWLDLCCAHMLETRKPDGFWTLSTCLAEALKYQSRSEWQKKSSGSMHAAKRNDWYEICTAHMENRQKPSGYWTLETCRNAALSYSSRSEWSTRDASSYVIARRQGWLDKCCAHMEAKTTPPGYWTLDRCKESAAKYQTRKAWRSADPNAWGQAYKNDWAQECCRHMDRLRVPDDFWTFDRCKSDAQQYLKRSAWKAASYGYRVAMREGWADECCAHMPVLRKRLTFEICLADARRYKKKSEWQKHSGSAYNAAYNKGWQQQCCAHMENKVG